MIKPAGSVIKADLLVTVGQELGQYVSVAFDRDQVVDLTLDGLFCEFFVLFPTDRVPPHACSLRLIAQLSQGVATAPSLRLACG